MEQAYLISIDELWLKGKNREDYFEIMREQLRNFLKERDLPHFTINNLGQRFLLQLSPSIEEEKRVQLKNWINNDLMEQLQRLPGLHTLTPALKANRDLESIAKVANTLVGEQLPIWQSAKLPGEKVTFKVETYRTDKKFSLNSMEVSREVGHIILEQFDGLKVKVTRPEHLVEVFIEREVVLVSVQYFSGIGGLPVGTSGRGLVLLSGGIDSPVAAAFMAKRGLASDFIFFHAYPYVGEDVVTKIQTLVSKLAPMIAPAKGDCKLYVIPIGKIQERIGLHCYPEYRTVLFRLHMMMLAQFLAQDKGYEALITGDGLSQVASQTLTNIAVIEKYLTIPVLRPLIGLNKIEIIRHAEKLGTMPVSMIPHVDACALFAPKHPTTKANRDVVQYFFDHHNMEQDLRDAIKQARVWSFNQKGEKIKIDAP